MAIKTKAELKAYFETGDVPTQSQFEDLIDSLLSINQPNRILNYAGIGAADETDPFFSIATGANTLATDLGVFTLPANTITQKGTGIHIKCQINNAANANNKTITFEYGTAGGAGFVCSEANNLNQKWVDYDITIIASTDGGVDGGAFILVNVKAYNPNTSTDGMNELSTPVEIQYGAEVSGFPVGAGSIDWSVDNDFKVIGQNGTASAFDIARTCFIVRSI